ncbi:hypothetical protein ACHZ98_34960, partial [Streptomyces sp. MAR4 CNY-716]
AYGRTVLPGEGSPPAVISVWFNRLPISPIRFRSQSSLVFLSWFLRLPSKKLKSLMGITFQMNF